MWWLLGSWKRVLPVMRRDVIDKTSLTQLTNKKMSISTLKNWIAEKCMFLMTPLLFLWKKTQLSGCMLWYKILQEYKVKQHEEYRV